MYQAEKIASNLVIAIKRHRLKIWIALLLLTGIILSFPVQLSYNFSPIESLDIFAERFPIFSVIYYGWVSILALLLITLDKTKKSTLEGLGLVLVFSAVYLGFWSIIAPIRTDDGLLSTANVNNILTQGSFVGNEHIFYNAYPALHITTASLDFITGLNVNVSESLILLSIDLLLPSLLYCLYSRAFKKPVFAAVSVIILINGSWYLSHSAFFYPGFFALVFLAALLLLLSRNQDNKFIGSWQNMVPFAIFLIVISMTHLVTSILLALVLSALLLIQFLSSLNFRNKTLSYEQTGSLVKWQLVALCSIIPIIWATSQGLVIFGNLISRIPNFITTLINGEAFWHIFLLGNANAGASVPLWASAVRFIWIFLIFGLGSVAVLVHFLKLKHLSVTEKTELAGVVGVMLLAIVAFLLQPTGSDVLRFMLYAPLFLVPLLIRLISTSNHAIGHILGRFKDKLGFKKSYKPLFSFCLVLLLLVVLSLPAFLVHNNTITGEAFYDYEFSAGQFSVPTYGIGTKLTIFFFGGTAGCLGYYLYDADHGPVIVNIKNQSDFWRQVNNSVIKFRNWAGGDVLFEFSQRGQGTYQHMYDVRPNDPHWTDIESNLNIENRVYCDKYVELYVQWK